MVFREVCPLVVAHITDHLELLELDAAGVRRFWLHQANLKMNQLIAKGVLGRVPNDDEAPVILNEYANTSSAGSVIAFHKHRADLDAGDLWGDLFLRGRILGRQRDCAQSLIGGVPMMSVRSVHAQVRRPDELGHSHPSRTV